ncbi:mechanosensitive ion channel family protein [Christiangramia forsetii]|uniref:Small-conductance mechanosensitive ion channel protein n=2 Tax=Christiangramia forsetii TaxID=411153 RepID=A0M1J7_CHRFK|nr:mechanosensitive ion channel domain-containing protein [Christiangramia forsetii]GGG42367.1 mechanosensitive ion channel protein MscS [Christiangramia forsetii]CAL66492.1 small-conductance mechanosensitive ion channel protein [Christiangramia forsetii KT0803]
MNIEEGLIDIICFFEELFVDYGMNAVAAQYLNLLINLVVLTLIVLGINYLIKNFIIEGFKLFTNKTKTTLDDFLIKSNFPRYVGRFLPLFVVYKLFPLIFSEFPEVLEIFYKLVEIYVIILIVWICRSVLRSTRNYLKTREEFNDKPLESFSQIIMIFIWIIGLMFIFSTLFNRSVLGFAISLGAASAVILLIFKDTILGLVASIQVSVNDIVRIGDWITFEKFGADGTVTEINLATVRVQNWDNTFTTIPTYSLISDSFQNWRGMQESPGRRIKRSVYIKQNSVKFLTSEEIDRLKKIKLIAPYLENRQAEIDKYNESNGTDKSLLINGRNQTNLGIFRKYADSYLHEHSAVHKEMYIIVRHMAPTANGIPLEILCFSKDKRWENFEYISADIFDHLIAAIPYFDLKLFEAPSGDDIRSFLERKSEI